MANYLVYQEPSLENDPNNLERLVDQELTVPYLKDIDNLTLVDFHTIVEDLRAKIYKLKGIDTQLRIETYEGKNYPMTVSNLGCLGEKSTKPIAHPPVQQLEPDRKKRRYAQRFDKPPF
jgi:hypothetical protein